MSEQQEKQSKPGLSTRTKAIIAGVVAVLAAIGIVEQATGSDTPAPSDQQVSTFNAGDAWLNCEDAVRAKLRNPDAADFSMLSSDIQHSDSGWFEISGTVEAQNDFGVKKELPFSCRVHQGQPVQATVTTD